MSDVDVAARRWAGALLTLGGLLPLVAVLNPRTWPVWGAGEAESWRLITERHVSMTAATWLIWAGVALSIAGVALLARMLGSALAIAALAVFATGASLALVSLTFEAAACSSTCSAPSTSSSGSSSSRAPSKGSPRLGRAGASAGAHRPWTPTAWRWLGRCTR